MASFSHTLTINTGENELFSVRWSPFDRNILVGSSDGTLKLYNSAGQLLNVLPCYTENPSPVTSVRWRPIHTSKTKNIAICTNCEGLIYHYHLSSGKILYMSLLNVGVLSCDYSEDGNHYAIGCDNSSVKVYDEQTKSLVRDYGEDTQGLHHCARVMAIKWASANVFWSAGWDKNVICWDYRMNRCARHLYGPKICGEAIDFYENSIITGSYDTDQQVQAWDLGSGRQIRATTVGENGDKCLVYSLQVNKIGDSKILAVSGSSTNSAYFYDLRDFTPQGVVAGINKPTYSLDFSNHEKEIVMCSGDGSIRVFSY